MATPRSNFSVPTPQNLQAGIKNRVANDLAKAKAAAPTAPPPSPEMLSQAQAAQLGLGSAAPKRSMTPEQMQAAMNSNLNNVGMIGGGSNRSAPSGGGLGGSSQSAPAGGASANLARPTGGMKRGGKIKKMSSGGMTSKVTTASSRGDGIAQRGKTKGRMI